MKKNPKCSKKTPSEKNENQKPTPEFSRNPEISQNNPYQNSPKTPENNTEEIDPQAAEEVV